MAELWIDGIEIGAVQEWAIHMDIDHRRIGFYEYETVPGLQYVDIEFTDAGIHEWFSKNGYYDFTFTSAANLKDVFLKDNNIKYNVEYQMFDVRANTLRDTPYSWRARFTIHGKSFMINHDVV